MLGDLIGGAKGMWPQSCYINGQRGVNVYVLVETKLDESLVGLLQSIWSNRWLGDTQKEDQGRSRGILILLDKRVWNGNWWRLGISGRSTGVNDELCWHLSAVYANCNRKIRRMLWENHNK